MKIFRWVVLAAVCLTWTSFSLGQSVDAFFGFNALVTKAGPSGVPKLGGGLYPNVGGDLIFLPHGLGIGAQVAWRGSMTSYNVRPVFYTFNLVWEPVAPGFSVRPDIAVGFGAENLRIYTGALNCGYFGCNNHSSSNHLVLHAGFGLKVYLSDHIFLRPSVDYYNIHNNVEFAVPNAWQVGVSIGYTLGPSS
ncbi:MAG TPA: hypothetical protein VMV31_02190 [Terriglobales bacterium]|nr:hypothetical protein [Terriglobales bacterium]